MGTTHTGIAWTQRTWNPTRGCRRVSSGCGGAAGEGGCYAERQAYRFSGPGQPYEGLVALGRHGPRWTGKGRLAAKTLAEPLSWRKPAMVFVDSMSDLFFDAFTNEEIAAVFGVMAACSDLTFQVLTKRAKRMREWFEWVERGGGVSDSRFAGGKLPADMVVTTCASNYVDVDQAQRPWPLPNVWIGCSVEDQRYADERIPELLTTPAAVRFVSAEPLLGPIDISCWMGAGNDERGPRIPGAACDRGVLGGRGGPNLASPPHDRRQSGRSSFVLARSGGTDARRDEFLGRATRELNNLPSGDVRHGGRLHTPLGGGASHRVDGEEPGRHPVGARGESQERRRGGQPTRQSGAGHAFREHEARDRGAREDSPAKEGFRRQADAAAGRRDPDTLRRKGDDADGAGAPIRRDDTGGSADRRTTNVAIDWVIIGGESGPGARPFDLAWARSVVEQCRAAGTAAFVKQLGARPVEVTGTTGGHRTHDGRRQIELTATTIPLRDRKGADMSEWPPDLRVQEFPVSAAQAVGGR